MHLPDIDSISNEQMQTLQQVSRSFPLARAAAAKAQALLDDANRAVWAEADFLAAAQTSADTAQQRLMQKLAAGIAGYRTYAKGLPWATCTRGPGHRLDRDCVRSAVRHKQEGQLPSLPVWFEVDLHQLRLDQKCLRLQPHEAGALFQVQNAVWNTTKPPSWWVLR